MEVPHHSSIEPKPYRSFISACAAILVLATAAMGQTVSSTVKGTVLDSSGAVVPGATCKLINPATNGSLTVSSGPDGAFQFLDVLPGTYRLTVAAPGFKNFDLMGLEILASEFHTVGSIVLRVGQASDSIVVSEVVASLQ